MNSLIELGLDWENGAFELRIRDNLDFKDNCSSETLHLRVQTYVASVVALLIRNSFCIDIFLDVWFGNAVKFKVPSFYICCGSV